MADADTDFSLEFIASVQAGDHNGWRVQNSGAGIYLTDQTGGQSWRLLPDVPCPAGRIAATLHQRRPTP